MNTQRLSLLLSGLVLFMIDLSSATETDIYCLKSIQTSIPQLANSWDFSNETEGFICSFIGIECWHPLENRVLNINLQNMGLTGEFPRSIANCTSLTGLNLSGNKLNGEIPSDISNLMPYATSIDLSKNQFSGRIPSDLSNCTFLNSLLLDHNRLSGQIPPHLKNLTRLREFSVASNNLTGPIPRLRASSPAQSYAHNPGLCGDPLPSC